MNLMFPLILYLYTGAVNGTNQNTPSVASSFNLGIVTAIGVVIVLVVVLLIVVVIFVILVVRHFKRSKEDHIAENPAFVALSDSSRTYDVPEIAMSLKLEVQDEIQKTSKDTKECGYDYANFTHRLERSEYVVSQTILPLISVYTIHPPTNHHSSDITQCHIVFSV